MKNKDKWTSGKFVYVKGKLKASGNPEEVAVSSRLMADLIAEFYDNHISKYIRGNLIDLGCGKVPLYDAYKNFIEDNTCVDWSDTLNKNPFVDIEQDLNQPLCLPDQSYDSIILSDVLEHIRKPDLLMNEMFRILKHKGKILLNVPFFYWIHAQPYDFFRYTEFALQSMAEDAGFNIIKLEAYGGAPEILADIHAKLIIRLPLIGKSFAKLIQKSTWLFIKTKIGRRLSKRSAKYFPLGYIMILEKP
jgi:SAM-dependent methyltransferase